jgi:hypothetical protein
MARMKELYLELQTKYGGNLEDLPENFSMEEFLKQKAEEVEQNESLERWKKVLSKEEFESKFPYYNK